MSSQNQKGNLWWVSEAIDSRLVRSLTEQGWKVKQIETDEGFVGALRLLALGRAGVAVNRLIKKQGRTLDNLDEETRAFLLQEDPTPDAVLVGNLTYTDYNKVIGYCRQAGLDGFVPFSGDPLINRDMLGLKDRYTEFGLAVVPKIIPGLGEDPQMLLLFRPQEFSLQLEQALATFRGQEAPGRGGGVENPRL